MNAYFCKYILPLYTFPLWRFQWSCQVASSGAGCLVYSGASGAPQRLEEALDTGTLARSARALTTCIRHVLPPRTLVPGTYVFTVTVSKGNLSSEASMEVGLGLGRYLTIIITHQCYPGGDHHRQPAHHLAQRPAAQIQPRPGHHRQR